MGPKVENKVMVCCVEDTTTERGKYNDYTPEQHAHINWQVLYALKFSWD